MGAFDDLKQPGGEPPPDEPKRGAAFADLVQSQAAPQAQAQSRWGALGDYLGGLGRQLREGATFGWGDEAVGAWGALGAGPFGSPQYQQAYERIRQREQEARQRFGAANPITSFEANIGGGAAAGSAIGNALGAVASRLPQAVTSLYQAMPRFLQSATQGGAAGAVAGAGASEPGNRTEGAVLGGVVGAPLGAGIDLVVKYGGKTLSYLIGKYLRRGAQTKAAAGVAEALQREGMTPADAEALIRTYGDDAVLADAGGQVRSLGVAALSSPNAPRRGVESALRQRHGTQDERLMSTVQQATGRSGLTLAYAKHLEDARKNATRPLYEAAYQKPIPMTPPLDDVLKLPDVRAAYRTGHKIAQDEAGKVLPAAAIDEATGAWTNPPTTMEWDWIARGIRSARDSAFRAGKRDVGRAKAMLLKRITDEVDAANPEFAAARKAHATGKSMEEALANGRQFFKETDDELLMQQFNDLSVPEQSAYLTGVVSAIRSRIRGMGRNKDVTAAAWLRSPDFEGKLTLLFGQQSADDILAKVTAESEKAITKNQALHQSMTADKRAIQEMLAGSDMQDVGRAVLRGDLTGAAMNIGKAFREPNSIGAAEAGELIDLLFTPGGQWQQPLTDALRPGNVQLSPFWLRRQQGLMPGPLPAVFGEQAGLFFEPLPRR